MAENENSACQQWLPLMGTLFLVLISVQIVLAGVFFWQVSHRRLPLFFAVSPKGEQMSLEAHQDPSRLPGVLLRWASRAAVAAYTFDFVNYQQQTELARRWFTPTGWVDYQGSLTDLIQTIASRQLFVNSVVSGPPVIALANESGWDIQMPFLVTYQSSDKMLRKTFLVRMKIVKVSTRQNPSGIGVDGFIMTGFT